MAAWCGWGVLFGLGKLIAVGRRSGGHRFGANGVMTVALATTTLAAAVVMTMTSGVKVGDGNGFGNGDGVGSEVAVWDPVRGIPPSVFHPLLLALLVLVAPVVIGWLFSDGYLDVVITEEWWRIVTFDTGPAGRRHERVRVQEVLAFGCAVQLLCLALLAPHGCNPPQTPAMVGPWRHLVDLFVGVFVVQWLLSHATAWAGAVDLVEARRERMRRLERERKERALAKSVQEAERELGRVARGGSARA